MSEWRETALGEAIDVRHGFAFRGEHFRDDGDLIVLTPGNFNEGGGFKPKSGKEKYYDGPYPAEYLLKEGDVVVAMTEQSQGLLGSTATIPVSNRFLHNQRLGLLRVTDSEKLDLRFCYYLMNSAVVRQQIQATATGSKVRHTAPERIRAVRIHLPSVATQKVVAGVLGAMDDLIENNRRRIELLEQMAQAIYREWFVQFRYPGHEDAGFVDSALGPIPEGWEVRTLGSVAGINVESRRPRTEEPVRYLDISSLGDRSLATPAQIRGEDAPGRARRVVHCGDIVWSMVRPARRGHALLVAPGRDWIASTGLAVLTPTRVSNAFLFETVSTPEFSDYLVSQEGGSAYPAVKPGDFEAALILQPTVGVDRAFDDVAGPAHRLAWELREESERLAAIRDLLLPKLVTGEIDVSDLDLDVPTESVA